MFASDQLYLFLTFAKKFNPKENNNINLNYTLYKNRKFNFCLFKEIITFENYFQYCEGAK